MDNRIETLISAISKLRDFENTRDDLLNIKQALDLLFDNAKCKNFIYTLNTDKLPFGCIVMPSLDTDSITSIMLTDQNTRFDSYEIELDSKVFDYGLTDKEVAAIIIYNIHHLTSDFTPGIRVKEYVDAYMANTDDNVVIKSSLQYQAILALGLCDALVKLTSCLYLPDDVETDAYLEDLDIDCLKDALNKLYKEIPGCENEALRNPRLTMLEWSLRLYNDVEKERIPAIHTMNKCKSISASVLYNNRMNAVINALNRIDTDYYVSEATMALSEANKSWIAKLRYNGLKDIENDLYEFNIRVKNAESEEDMWYVLKQINSRINILDEYLRDHGDEDPDADRWRNVLMQYKDIRQTLVKNGYYKHKGFGIAIDYEKFEKDENRRY